MKKYISYLISVWLLTTMLAACADETTNFIVQDEQGVLTLQLSSKTLATRAVIDTEAGEDAWNENAIKTVDCFFYPDGKTGEAAVFSATGINVGATTIGTATVSIKIPNDKIEALFGTMRNTCEAYVMVNRPAASALGTDTSISGLKKTVIEAEGFATQSSVATAQESFVMDGEEKITLSSDRRSVTGNIDLYRAASKISLFITKVEQTVTDEAGNEWTSQPENMKVFFHNGVKKAHVDVSANGCAYAVQPEDYFNFSLSEETRGFEAVKAENGDTEYYKHAPFYSYSSDWNNDEEHEAYLTLVVPWKKSGESEFKSCYYQIPVNVTNKKFERNNYYKIKLSVGILGDFNPDAPVELNPSYIIVDWGSGEVTADIKEYRYLVVDKNYVVMDNVNEVSIPFLTSHEVELVDIEVTRPVLKNGKDNEFENINASKYALIANNTHHVITFTHDLNNNQSDKNNYDYVPYTITFTCRHKDMVSIKEDITIMQYPALYIVAQTSTNRQETTGKWWWKYGYTFINGSNATNASFGGLEGFGYNSNNYNEHMYTINTSAFNDNTYIIGDPRKQTVDLLDYNSWTTAITTSGTGRKLMYYYPTETTSTSANIIAPKFRIASSYGMTNSIGFESAQRRCAAYQEDGYPAGRWRVPTKAEIKYIVKISAEHKIPRLFNNNGLYWSADEKICKPDYDTETVTESTGNSAYVRCVYDEWYWTDTVDKGTFTWGDKQR